MTAATGIALLMLLAFAAQQAQGVNTEAHRRLAGSEEDTLADVFQRWVEKHGRVYRSEGEFQKRFQIFKANVYYMHRHNTQQHNMEGTQQQEQKKNYWMGLNKFSDLTHEEFRARFVGGYRSSSASRIRTSDASEEELAYFSYRGVVPAPSVDWRAKGAVSPIKDQGQCGNNTNTKAVELAHYHGGETRLSALKQKNNPIVPNLFSYSNVFARIY
jgi:hypothetical protein